MKHCDAEDELQSIPDYLVDSDGLQDYLAELKVTAATKLLRPNNDL